ncbi:nitrilase-related carbon-nitrogen hydrolase [Roseomonas sp. USHLN139]|uniref:nitrilase-related carbon-nitrogen hydrolase n=1 Tax=Roseomonas sp. USHLN139 TaxID=3081298 RepID=UPI003B0143D3
MRIAAAPLAPIAGALAANAAGILAAHAAAARAGAELLVTPLASLTGAPLHDLLADAAFHEAAEAVLQQLVATLPAEGPALLLGTVWQEAGAPRQGVVLVEGGRVAARRPQHFFQAPDPLGLAGRCRPGPAPGPLACRGIRLGLLPGADAGDAATAETLLETGAELLLALPATPFDATAAEDRASDRALARVVETGLPLLALSLRGAGEDLLFPGGGFALNADHRLAARLPEFAADLWITDWAEGADGWAAAPQPLPPLAGDAGRLAAALQAWLRAMVAQGGAAGVVVPLGAPASALLALLAAEALGSAATLLTAAPEDAAARHLADRLRRPLHPLPAGRAEGFAADRGALLLNPLDKRDAALGRAAPFGHLAPLRDLTPGAWSPLAAARGLPVPDPDPDEPALLALIEGRQGMDSLAAAGYDPAGLRRLAAALARAEPLRRRLPPGPALGPLAFGRHRRYPAHPGPHSLQARPEA